MTFEDFLKTKKIDENLFKNQKPLLFEEWKLMYNQTSIESFVLQKKMLINKIRREFLMVNDKC
jgi:hypothetical protein